ncbi:unnamed protein product [Callosobruchus maculatus]|uniref:RING-type domain-containing protein n=1 Tax=Callosobruchus maculatus TaxID=64391 RepID=A0A653BP36_CALMS|nr:unnamed protein product [Callosobruchus maculatus]
MGNFGTGYRYLFQLQNRINFTFAHFCQGSCTICRVLNRTADDVGTIGHLETHPESTMASETYKLSPLVHERAAEGQRRRKGSAKGSRRRYILCAVCETTVQSEDLKKAACGDVFHAFCLSEWRKHSRKCPECRARI